VYDEDARRKRYPARGGILFNHYDILTGELTDSGQVRHQHPLVYEGKARKFSLIKGSMTRPYGARSLDWKAAAKNPKIDLFISEGPTRALAGAQRGLYVLSLLGVTCHGMGDELDPTLANINWKGRRVCIAFDCDAENNSQVRSHEQKLARKLTAQCAQVFIVRVPSITAGGHAGLDDLLALPGGLETFRALCSAAPQWKATTTETLSNGLQLVRCADVADIKQAWITPELLPDATLTILAGQAGSGKTTCALAMAAAITNGVRPVVGGKMKAGTVLMLSNEDAPAAIRRNFQRLGGNLTRLLIEDNNSGIWLLDDLDSLDTQLATHKPDAVIVDSLYSHRPNKTDMNSHAEVVPFLLKLRQLSEKHGCATILIHHTNKLSTTDPLAKISGSGGIVAIGRHVLLIGVAPDDPNVRVIACAKTNLAKPGAPGYKFTLDPFKFIGTSEFRAADLLDNNPRSAPRAGEAFLAAALAEGSRETKRLEEMSKATGISRATLHRAAKVLRVVSQDVAGAFPRRTEWTLPNEGLSRARRESVCETTTTTPIDKGVSLLSHPPVVSVSRDETTGETTGGHHTPKIPPCRTRNEPSEGSMTLTLSKFRGIVSSAVARNGGARGALFATSPLRIARETHHCS
jgi:hypothetical protein